MIRSVITHGPLSHMAREFAKLASVAPGALAGWYQAFSTNMSTVSFSTFAGSPLNPRDQSRDSLIWKVIEEDDLFWKGQLKV